jgi:natural product precursor
MKKLKFIEEPNDGKKQNKLLFPQLFNMSSDELSKLKGGYDCPSNCALCYPSEWGCNCHSNLC